MKTAITGSVTVLKNKKAVPCRAVRLLCRFRNKLNIHIHEKEYLNKQKYKIIVCICKKGG